SDKGIAGGYAALDMGALVPLAQIPDLPESKTRKFSLSKYSPKTITVPAPTQSATLLQWGTFGAGQMTNGSTYTCKQVYIGKIGKTQAGPVSSSVIMVNGGILVAKPNAPLGLRAAAAEIYCNKDGGTFTKADFSHATQVGFDETSQYFDGPSVFYNASGVAVPITNTAVEPDGSTPIPNPTT